MSDSDQFVIFAGSAHPQLAQDIASALGQDVGAIRVTTFSDGETHVKIDQSVRGQDLFLVQPTSTPVNHNLMELLIMVDACRRASARRITVVMPYYGYARQDKKVKPREPITARLVANLITQAGASRVLCVDLHANQLQGFFDIPVDHLTAGPLLADHFNKAGLCGEDVLVVSPDVGGVARAGAFAAQLRSPLAIIAKRRPAPNQVEIMEIIGDVRGRTCILFDDMIDTAGTICQGAAAVMERGAKEVYACCTHGVLSGPALQRLERAPLRTLVVTDTVPAQPDAPVDKILRLSVAPLLADAIRRIHEGQSVSELFQTYASGQPIPQTPSKTVYKEHNNGVRQQGDAAHAG